MLVLASNSQTRKRLLQDIGLPFQVVPSLVDEDALKDELSQSPIPELALKLGQAKAAAVSATHPSSYVLGCDLIVSCEGRRFDKARSFDDAREQLQALRGKEHEIHSGISLFHQEQECWNHLSTSYLKMWHFSDEFLDCYLNAVMPDILNYAGSYHVAGKGAHLFEEIRGDVFAIQGLQIFPLLGFLRENILPQQGVFS